jgi:hypothetical protein
VEAGHPKKFGTMFFENCLRLLSGLTISSALLLLKRVNDVIAGIGSFSPWLHPQIRGPSGRSRRRSQRFKKTLGAIS